MSEADTKRRRGRPCKHALLKVQNNYAALAFWAQEQIDQAAIEGIKLTFKRAVRHVMKESVQRRNDYKDEADKAPLRPPTRMGLVDTKIKTAYTEARKIRAKLRKEKKT